MEWEPISLKEILLQNQPADTHIPNSMSLTDENGSYAVFGMKGKKYLVLVLDITNQATKIAVEKITGGKV